MIPNLFHSISISVFCLRLLCNIACSAAHDIRYRLLINQLGLNIGSNKSIEKSSSSLATNALHVRSSLLLLSTQRL